MEKISTRIEQFIKYKQISTRAFEQKIGASNGLIANAIKKNTGINSKWLSKIIETYTDLNAYWLLIGRGNMIRPPGEEMEGDILNEPQAVYKTARDIETENTLLKQEKKFLNKEIEYLKNEISLKDKIIKLLENK